MLTFIFVAITSVIAGCISGVVGTGSSILLLPVLISAFDAKTTIPILAISAVVANLSRLFIWWNAIKWQTVFYYVMGAIPGVIIGANTLWMLPEHLVNLYLGLFFLALLPLRYWAKKTGFVLSRNAFICASFAVGLLTGLVFTTGPITVPLFAGAGLTLGPLLATEAAGSFIVYLAKTATFGSVGGLSLEVIISGLLVGAGLAFGAYIGKRIILKMPEVIFRYLIDGLILIAAIVLLTNAF